MHREYTQIKTQLDLLQKRIAELPPGCIYPRKRGKYISHTHEYHEKGKRVRRHVRKADVEWMTAAIDKRRRMEGYRKSLISRFRDVEEKIREMGLDPEAILQEDAAIDSKYHDRRQESEMNMAADHFHNNRYVTFNGENVRSKSEQIIADLLALFDIPYAYEGWICLNGRWYQKDFTILPGERDIIWEHCGMLENTKYRENWEQKKSDYAAEGYVEGKNLIITYESKGFDTLEVQYIIERFLKPRY